MNRGSSSSRRKQRLGSLLWGFIALFLGWVPFVYWWRQVILSEESGIFIGLLIWLITALVIVGFGSASWIAHNQRIARRGNRGLATRFYAIEHGSDRLGRTLEIPCRAELRSAARIVVRAQADVKTYSVWE